MAPNEGVESEEESSQSGYICEFVCGDRVIVSPLRGAAPYFVAAFVN